MTSSLLFVGTTCGYTVGTLLVPHIMHFLGCFYLAEAKLALLPTSPFRIALSGPSSSAVGHSASQSRYLVLILASVCSPTGFIMLGSKSGFPTMFMAYVVVSFGRAILTAIFTRNMFLSQIPSKPLGLAFGVWGLGAVASPLVFQVTAAAGLPWAHFYFGSLVLAAVNYVFLGITFMPTAREFSMDRKKAFDEADARSRPPSLTPDSKLDITSGTSIHSTRPNRKCQSSCSSHSSLRLVVSELRLVSSIPYQWAVSLFTLFYCGSETTAQGLIVQYLLAERSANPNTVGYVTSGFWAGICASRLAWSYFSPRQVLLATPSAYLTALGLGLAMQLSIWFIDSTIENAVAISLLGVLFGPMFPVCLELANDLLPVELAMISMAFILNSRLSANYFSTAILPFITGVVTTKYGMRCWSYITVAQVAILSIAWYLFPTRQPLRRALAE
ncbi:major facilitator superfamily domain-containing protein [Mycena epipterygia]|nr:major facilitator superfamily domain-containing protein [Mycena epipterygia]